MRSWHTRFWEDFRCCIVKRDSHDASAHVASVMNRTPDCGSPLPTRVNTTGIGMALLCREAFIDGESGVAEGEVWETDRKEDCWQGTVVFPRRHFASSLPQGRERSNVSARVLHGTSPSTDQPLDPYKNPSSSGLTSTSSRCPSAAKCNQIVEQHVTPGAVVEQSPQVKDGPFRRFHGSSSLEARTTCRSRSTNFSKKRSGVESDALSHMSPCSSATRTRQRRTSSVGCTVGVTVEFHAIVECVHLSREPAARVRQEFERQRGRAGSGQSRCRPASAQARGPVSSSGGTSRGAAAGLAGHPAEYHRQAGFFVLAISLRVLDAVLRKNARPASIGVSQRMDRARSRRSSLPSRSASSSSFRSSSVGICRGFGRGTGEPSGPAARSGFHEQNKLLPPAPLTGPPKARRFQTCAGRFLNCRQKPVLSIHTSR